MVTANNLRDAYNQNNRVKGGRTALPSSGKLTVISKRMLDRLPGPPNARYRLVDTRTNGNPAGLITEAQAAADMTLIESLYFHVHGNVKNDARWHHLYRRAQRTFNFLNNAGNVVTQNLWSYPCHYCGFILPEQFIDVDHRQPQRHPGVAVLKVLHALNHNYTTQPATGTKGTQVVAISGATTPLAIQNLNQVPVSGLDWVTAWRGGNTVLNTNANKLARYTITDAGKTFLAVCTMYWGIKTVEKVCLNSLLNLVPACRMCNGAGGKGSMTHAGQ